MTFMCMRKRSLVAIFGAIALLASIVSGVAHADAAFQHWLQSTWPDAQKLGVSRATFDAAIAGLEPDYSLPDLAIPGRPEKPPQGQPEFVQTPGQYLREPTFQRLAARGKQFAAQYRDTLARIEKTFGVPGNVVLAIWARETDYGREVDGPRRHARAGDARPISASARISSATNSSTRLKMLQDGVPRSDLRSSWGGAMGLTQFLPSEFYKYAVDFDGDGNADIWHSVPDALASAAKQLKDKGWRSGEPWAIEVRVPANVDCTLRRARPTRMPIGDWLKRGFVPAYGRKLPAARTCRCRRRCCCRKAPTVPAS